MSGSQVLSHSLLILYQNWLQKSSFFFGICNLFYLKDECHGGLALLLSFPPGVSSTLRAGLGVECRYGVIISMSRAVLHLILPSSSTYIIPRLVAKCQVYSTFHHYFIVLFLFSTFTGFEVAEFRQPW